MADINLLPCPHCAAGGEPYLQEYANGRTPPDRSWMVICRKCRLFTGKFGETSERAADDWNNWPRWRRPHAALTILQERRTLDKRIRNQRARLREFERWIQGAIDNRAYLGRKRYLYKSLELAAELKAANEESATLRDRCEKLEKALEPFARIADMEERAPTGSSTIVNIDRCRDARAALDQDKRGGE